MRLFLDVVLAVPPVRLVSLALLVLAVHVLALVLNVVVFFACLFVCLFFVCLFAFVRMLREWTLCARIVCV